MPWKPKTLGSGRNQNRVEYDRKRDRDFTYRRWYKTARWQKSRELFLRQHPLCVECAKEGRDVPATDVDHIRPHRGNYDLFWNVTNWQPLCGWHHDRKTARGA